MGSADDFNHTLLSLKVSKILLTERRRRHWNYELAKRSGATARATFGILSRFKARGWVMNQEETPPPIVGRSPRVLYTLTEMGAQAMADALSALQLAST